MQQRIPGHAGRARALLAILLPLLLVAVLAAAFAGPAAATTTDYASTIKDGRAAAQAALQQSGADSLSLALVSGDRVVWQEAFGYADKATSTPPSADTMYGIGSVSKMLATVAAMQLVDAGKVDLDAPFTRYVPSFAMASPAFRQITVRMLLDHSSGLPGSTYTNWLTRTYYPGYLQQVLDALATEQLKTTPGYMSVYCNDGFTLIEALVAAVDGRSYAQYVQDEILAPLGMTHSAYPLTPFADGTYARLYAGDTARPLEVLNLLASGALYSTPTDLGRLATMLLQGGTFAGKRLLSSAAIAEMGTSQTAGSYDPVPDVALDYGLGWDTVVQPGLKAVGVTGWMKGGDSVDYHAGFIVAPRAKLAVAVLGVAPLDSSGLEALGERILLHALVDQKTIKRMPKPLPSTAPPVKAASSAQLDAMRGYWAGNGMVLRVGDAATGAQALDVSRLGAGGWSPFLAGLKLRTDGLFHADGSSSGLRTMTAGGRRYLVWDSVGGSGHYRTSMLLGQRLAAQAPLSPAWQARMDKVWFAVNELPDSAAYTVSGMAVLSLGEIPGLPGYVVQTFQQPVIPVSDTLGAMFLQIPGAGSRDLEDVVIEKRGGEDWLWWGATLYRPESGLSALSAGSGAVKIGAEGYGEWRSLASAGTVTIGAGGGATTWYLYDPDDVVLASGTTFPATAAAPEPGCYLLLFGPAGSSTTVTYTPAAGAAAGPAAADGAHPRIAPRDAARLR